MKRKPEDLRKISTLTLEHYNQRAEAFRDGTRDHDVSQNIAALLDSIEAMPPFTILDFGCGPGRDLKTFASLGHIAIGLEGAARFAEWRGRNLDARCGSRIFFSSTFRMRASMAYSPMRR